MPKNIFKRQKLKNGMLYFLLNKNFTYKNKIWSTIFNSTYFLLFFYQRQKCL